MVLAVRYTIQNLPSMNKVIIVGLAFVVAAASVSAQGTFAANSATGARPRIVVEGAYDSHYALPTDNVWVQILVNGAPSALDPFQLTLTGPNAGLFAKGTVTVAGIPGGSTANITIRAWDKDTGADYASAWLKDEKTLYNFILGGAVDANGIPGLPNSIVPAFTGLDLYIIRDFPEPSTYALAAFGLGGLLFFRRK